MSDLLCLWLECCCGRANSMFSLKEKILPWFSCQIWNFGENMVLSTNKLILGHRFAFLVAKVAPDAILVLKSIVELCDFFWALRIMDFWTAVSEKNRFLNSNSRKTSIFDHGIHLIGYISSRSLGFDSCPEQISNLTWESVGCSRRWNPMGSMDSMATPVMPNHSGHLSQSHGDYGKAEFWKLDV